MTCSLVRNDWNFAARCEPCLLPTTCALPADAIDACVFVPVDLAPVHLLTVTAWRADGSLYDRFEFAEEQWNRLCGKGVVGNISFSNAVLCIVCFGLYDRQLWG